MYLPTNVVISHCNLERFKYDDKDNLKYKDLNDTIKNQQFDLIIIDGPQGWLPTSPVTLQEFPRSNIWDLVETNLKEDFVIIIDDYDRMGEQNTVKILKERLHECEIEYDFFVIGGLKKQAVLFSRKFKFIKWF